MNNKNEHKEKVKATNLENLRIRFYGLLAIIFVLIPEWMAEVGLTIENDQFKSDLPTNEDYIYTDAYYFISSLKLRKMRKIASLLKIHGYSCDNRKKLITRLMTKLKHRKSMELVLEALKSNKLC